MRPEHRRMRFINHRSRHLKSLIPLFAPRTLVRVSAPEKRRYPGPTRASRLESLTARGYIASCRNEEAMQKFTTLTGIAAHLPMINVDTDMIIPKQYLKTIKRTGLSKGLFAELRYDEEGKPL